MQQQSPLDYSLRPKQGQGFGFPKALRKLFREPGPHRSSDLRSKNVSFDVSTPNLSSSSYPAQQYHINFSPVAGQTHLQLPHYGAANDAIVFPSSTETFDTSLPNQAPFQDAYPARVSFDQRAFVPVPENDEERSPGWAKRVLQPFSRVRKLKESFSQSKDDKGANYPVFTHRDLEQNNIPQAYVTKKPSLTKRKPVPPISGSSLDSQLFPTIGRKRIQSNFEMTRDPFIRYSVGEVVKSSGPEAIFMNQHTSSGYQDGTSAMPRQSALGLDLGDYNLMNAASFPSPRFAGGKYMYKNEEQQINTQWSSDTVSRAARHAMPLAPQTTDPSQLHVDDHQKDEEISIVESAPTGENVKMAKEYANRKFDEWISRTPNVSAFPTLHTTLNSKKAESTQAQHDPIASIEPLKIVKQTNPFIQTGKIIETEDDQKENEGHRTSSKAPVDPMELNARLSDLAVRSKKESALKRTSHQKCTTEKKSNPNLSRNLAAKMMSETPNMVGFRYSGTMWPEDQSVIDRNDEKTGEITPRKDTLKKEKEKASNPPNCMKPELEEKKCTPKEQEDVCTTPIKRKDATEQACPAHEKLQARHWRSTEVLYQDTRLGNDPIKAKNMDDTREKEDVDSAIGVVEPVTISSEEVELLSRVQTWRSCVSITPMKKLYAPSASATVPSTMTGMNQVHTGADERASEWTSISRRVEKGVEIEPVPMQRAIHYDSPQQKYDEFNDRRASKSYQIAETRTSMRYIPAPHRTTSQDVGDGPGHISFQGPPLELIRFLQYSFDLSSAKKDQDSPKTVLKKDEELLIDLTSPEVEKRPQKLQFGTQHIRQMTEADSKRLFDLIGDKLSNSPHPEQHGKPEGNSTKKVEVESSKSHNKTPEKVNHVKRKSKEDEAKVWELLHQIDKDGLTAMERLLNAYAEELGTFARGNDHKAQPPHPIMKEADTHKNHNSPSSKKKSKEMSKPSTSYNTSRTKVDDENMENILQSIFEYVQGAGDVSQIHSTLISMHKDLLDRTKEPGQRKSIDERLMKLEQAVFAKK